MVALSVSAVTELHHIPRSAPSWEGWAGPGCSWQVKKGCECSWGRECARMGWGDTESCQWELLLVPGEVPWSRGGQC